jgi:hypothetical protein
MKFSIRDLLLVTVIVALVLGWWVDRNRLADRVEQWEHSMPGMLPPYFGQRFTEQGTNAQSLKTEDELFEEERKAFEKARKHYEWRHRWDQRRFIVPNSSAPAPNPPKEYKE